jgi:hypothetical protein
VATNLPTLTVPDTQAARVLEAFKAKFATATTAETAKAYRQWLAGEVRAIVLEFEAQRIDEANNTSKRSQLAVIEADLPDPAAVL